MLPVSVWVVAAGGIARDLTRLLDGAPRFSTAAVGGFADATFTLRGDQRRKVPYLAMVRVMLGTTLLYEGQVEDADPSGSGDSLTTTVTCFGLRNLLSEGSIRRFWSKRNLDWQDFTATSVTAAASPQVTAQVGQFDPTDLTKGGVRFQGQSVAFSLNNRRAVSYQLPSGLTAVSLLGTYAEAGTTGNFAGAISSSSDGSAFTDHTLALAAGAFSQALVANARIVVVGMQCTTGYTPTSADTADFYDMRLLGTSLAEDASGGYYGGTILRDLIALIPGLTPGIIEAGSDFTIQAIERSVRSAALDIVQEVAGYYTREWAVWDGGRFDWKTRQLDQPDWLTIAADYTQLSIKGSLDGMARSVYVLYTDAASGLTAEASAVATAQRNPYVKQSRAKDLIVDASFPMTANTSAQLAARIAGDVGQWVPVQGTLSLPATKTIRRALGTSSPAACIRAGDNVAITDLPKSDIFQQGRDGETLFHIVGTNCDLEAGTVTLELEGQASRTDVILARLAAVTRTLTG